MSNRTCNLCLGKPWKKPQQLLPMEPGWMWRLVVYGDADMSGISNIKVFNPLTLSNSQSIASCYKKHENVKKRHYDKRVREIEHGTFTPVVLLPTGGMGTQQQQQCASRGWPLCSPTRGMRHTAPPYGLTQMLTKIFPTGVVHPVYKRGPLCFRTNSLGPTPPSGPCVL